MIETIQCNLYGTCIFANSCLVIKKSSKNSKGDKIGKYHPELSIVFSGAFFIHCKDYCKKNEE